MLHVKILGSGDWDDQQLETETRAALQNARVPFVLTVITDSTQIAAYGVLSTPALVLNERVFSTGRIPARATIIAWARAFVHA